MRISCPPTIAPCFYGVDTPRRSELIGATHTVDEIRRYLDADSLGYLSLEGLLACMKKPTENYCTACWSGKYKVPIDQPQSKFSFERDQLKMF